MGMTEKRNTENTPVRTGVMMRPEWLEALAIFAGDTPTEELLRYIREHMFSGQEADPSGMSDDARAMLAVIRPAREKDRKATQTDALEGFAEASLA